MKCGTGTSSPALGTERWCEIREGEYLCWSCHISQMLTGRKLPESTKAKITRSLTGKERSLESRIKQSETITGRHLDQATRLKISESHKGMAYSQETKQKLSKIRTGIKMKAETIEKIRLKGYGRQVSQQTREKLKLARRKKIIPKRDNKPEKMLQSGLLEIGINYETHKAIEGQPDIFIEPNIVVFCDGDYYHCNPNPYPQRKAGWKPDDIRHGKLAKEVWSHDADITTKLTQEGYVVLRFWENEIISNVQHCLNQIQMVVKNSNAMPIIAV